VQITGQERGNVSEESPPSLPSYGWRARIGFLRPGIIDETLSQQFYRMAPDGVSLVSVGLGVDALTRADMRDAIDQIETASRNLARRKPGCIVVGGSHTVVFGGVGADVALADRIHEACGIPTTTAQTAAVEAMRRLNVRSLALVSPFPDEFHEQLKRFLADSGFDVRSDGHLPGEYRQLSLAPLQATYELARAVHGRSNGVDGIYFAGAPMPVVDIIERIERELATNVVTSMQATLRKGLDLCGASDVRVDGYGHLLRL
jgi:maleate isomerase